MKNTFSIKLTRGALIGAAAGAIFSILNVAIFLAASVMMLVSFGSCCEILWSFYAITMKIFLFGKVYSMPPELSIVFWLLNPIIFFSIIGFFIETIIRFFVNLAGNKVKK